MPNSKSSLATLFMSKTTIASIREIGKYIGFEEFLKEVKNHYDCCLGTCVIEEKTLHADVKHSTDIRIFHRVVYFVLKIELDILNPPTDVSNAIFIKSMLAATLTSRSIELDQLLQGLRLQSWIIGPYKLFHFQTMADGCDNTIKTLQSLVFVQKSILIYLYICMRDYFDVFEKSHPAPVA